jgi:hypothetical protein
MLQLPPITLDKRYIDVLLPDQTVLLLYIGELKLLHLRAARVMADLYLADGTQIHAAAGVERLQAGRDSLQAGPLEIDGDRLTFYMPALAGQLVYHSRWPACSLREPFLEQRGRRLMWTLEVPDADVEGRLTWPSGRLDVSGRGYRDRVWLNFPLWRFPIRRLDWGRAVAGCHAATWVRAATAGRTVATSWVDGKTLAECQSIPASGVALGPYQPFVDTDIVDVLRIRPRAFRTVAHRLLGGIHETKRRGQCLICGHEGVAVHEVVTWGTPVR